MVGKKNKKDINLGNEDKFGLFGTQPDLDIETLKLLKRVFNEDDPNTVIEPDYLQMYITPNTEFINPINKHFDSKPNLEDIIIIKEEIRNKKFFIPKFDNNYEKFPKKELNNYKNIFPKFKENFDFNKINTPEIPLFDYINQHNDLLQQINSEHFFKVELVPTRFVKLSAEYAQKISEMSNSITIDELKQTLVVLRVGPLVQAASNLASVLTDKQQLPSKLLKIKVQQLQSCYLNSIDTESLIGQLLNQDISRVSMEIFNPALQGEKKLNDMLIRGGACTADRFNRFNFGNSPANNFAKDSKAGGSVHFLASNGHGSSYNRMYLAVDKEGKPTLFYDCVESQNMMLRTIEDYLSSGKGSQMLASFLSSIVIANRLGLEAVSLGEDETLVIGRELGFGERKIFREGSNYEQKLGYRASSKHTEGPYGWRINSSKSFRTFDPSFYSADVIYSIAVQSNEMMKFVEGNRKRLNSLRNDFGNYFSMVKEIMDSTGLVKVAETIEKFCIEYNIELNEFNHNNKKTEIIQHPATEMNTPVYSKVI